MNEVASLLKLMLSVSVANGLHEIGEIDDRDYKATLLLAFSVIGREVEDDKVRQEYEA